MKEKFRFLIQTTFLHNSHHEDVNKSETSFSGYFLYLEKYLSHKTQIIMSMQKTLLIFLILSFCANTYSQQTVGLFSNTAEASAGYTLFAPMDSYETYLIDNCGEKVHSWTSDYKPGLSCYLLENGILLRTGRIMSMGMGSGIVEMIDWEGNVIWDYSSTSTHGRQHHDIEMLPNGNILLIVSDERSQAEVIQAGSTTQNDILNSEQIIEVQPDLENGGATVVWEWKAWDHLIQDADFEKDDFGTIAQKPERIDINFLNHNNPDWLHINGVDYNEEFDQIIISVHNFSEFWIIDHSTSTIEAADSSGGIYGKGGDLLYRWGNPQAYDQGTANDQKLFLQHNTYWIENSLPDAGKIMLFNNQAGNLQGQNYSTVNIVELPVDQNGFYAYTGGAYAPVDFDWTYQADTPTDFFSNIISGAHRLENGNTLICEGVRGRFFEVDTDGNTVWEYINPVNEQGAITQNDPVSDNNVFRCTRYDLDYPGFDGQDLIPQGYIEPGSTFSCELFTATEEVNLGSHFKVYPNPASDFFTIEYGEALKADLDLKLFDLSGKFVFESYLSKGGLSAKIDIRALHNGIYFIQFSNDAEIWTEKLIISKNQ